MRLAIESLDSGRLFINSGFSSLLKLNGLDSAESLWRLGGETVKRALKERGTERVLLKTASGATVTAYLKRYTARPWTEILKSALSFKFKFFGAFEEWASLLAFHEAELPTMDPLAVARCAGGECLLTLGIEGFERSSELYPKLAADNLRRKDLILKVARLAGAMHSEGMAHQDFYLVHIFVMQDDTLKLIDLQRMIHSKPLALRWVVKDLGQLFFSVKGSVQPGDVALFVREYARVRKISLRTLEPLLSACASKAEAISRHDARRAMKKT